MYDELVKSLRQCAEASCAGCKNDLVQIGCRGLLQHEAADAIEDLICEVADEHNARLDAEERQRWIPVTEQLIHSGWYLVACNERGEIVYGGLKCLDLSAKRNLSRTHSTYIAKKKRVRLIATKILCTVVGMPMLLTVCVRGSALI